jgi:dTDP-4-amino-4,6-dideoxy-D-galactose acyltransferase
METSLAFAALGDTADWPTVRESFHHVLSTWEYLPYLQCREAGSEGRIGYVLASLAAAQQHGATTLTAPAAGRLQALAQWEILPWDTQMLGFATARISALYRSPSPAALSFQHELLEKLLAQARGAGVRYLMVRVPAGDVAAIDQLENLGFRTVDGILSFGRSLDELAPAEGAPVVRRAEAQDIPALREIAGSSFALDRFHSDPIIGKDKADDVQRAWVDNSCQGFADCVLVAVLGGEIAGFTTLKLDRTAERELGIKVGLVDLVAISPRYRRRGLAHALSLSSLRWFRDAGCGWVEVGTQLANVHAARVYQSAGFRLTASSLTLRQLL